MTTPLDTALASVRGPPDEMPVWDLKLRVVDNKNLNDTYWLVFENDSFTSVAEVRFGSGEAEEALQAVGFPTEESFATALAEAWNNRDRILDLERQLAAMTLARDSAIGMAKDLGEKHETLRLASWDALRGWRYIRQHHGDLYGIGWDRVEDDLGQALAAGGDAP